MRLALALLAVVLGIVRPTAAASPFDGLCATASAACVAGPYFTIVSAFPAEARMLRAAADVSERLEIEGRSVIVGRLAGRPVVLAFTGIGLLNATNTTRALLAQLDVAALLFSGVAGSRLRIGDVAVPVTWTDVASGLSYPVDPDLLAHATSVASAPLELDQCTPVPPDPPGPEVCLAHTPTLFVGGRGESSDPFGGTAPRCTPDGGAVFGCEARAAATGAAEPIAIEAVDMESAAVAAVAAANGVPFLAVRGVSDGPGDPLNLPGFPAQFFAYYRLAADNAAAVMLRLVAELPAPAAPPARPQRPRLTAACGFARAASVACAAVAPPRRVTRLVSRACALRAEIADAHGVRAVRLGRRARGRLIRAAALVERALPSSCAAPLGVRLRDAATHIASGSMS